ATVPEQSFDLGNKLLVIHMSRIAACLLGAKESAARGEVVDDNPLAAVGVQEYVIAPASPSVMACTLLNGLVLSLDRRGYFKDFASVIDHDEEAICDFG